MVLWPQSAKENASYIFALRLNPGVHFFLHESKVSVLALYSLTTADTRPQVILNLQEELFFSTPTPVVVDAGYQLDRIQNHLMDKALGTPVGFS